jgi:hypothetical protein
LAILYSTVGWLRDGSFEVKSHQRSLLPFLPGAFLVLSLVVIIIILFVFIMSRSSLLRTG